MSFNSTDFTKAPYGAGIMTLNHEECSHVINTCNGIKVENPDRENDDFYIIGEYNLIDWKKGINGDTYNALKPYNLEVNTQGINEFGIIPEPEIEEPTEPPVEPEPEPEVPTEPEAPVEEPTEETPAE